MQSRADALVDPTRRSSSRRARRSSCRRRRCHVTPAALLARTLQIARPALAAAMSLRLVSTDRRCDAGRCRVKPHSPPAWLTAGLRLHATRPISARRITSGPWAHLPAPQSRCPAWIAVRRLRGVLADATAHAAATAGRMLVARGGRAGPTGDPAYAVVVDVPLGADAARAAPRRHRHRDRRIARSPRVGAHPLRGRRCVPAADGACRTVGGRRRATLLQRPLDWVTFLDYADWDTGAPARCTVPSDERRRHLRAHLRDAARSSATSASASSCCSALALVGALFLVIQVVALGMGLALARSITGSVHDLFEGTERVRAGDFTHRIADPARAISSASSPSRSTR